MLAVTEPGVKEITVKCCTQLLKTEFINNVVGYFMHQDPSPMIVMQPTVNLAQSWSKDRLDKMLRDTPVLQGRVKDKRSKGGENTILHKSFPGGHITMVGSNSPTDLASRPVRIVCMDEKDKYPDSAGNEGDPAKLLRERTDTFWNALVVNACSPTLKGRSKIEADYERSDKRVFCGQCPYCNEHDELVWSQVKWDKDELGNHLPETAHYVCSKCNAPWTEVDRLKAISVGRGKYVATAPFTGHAGFKANKIASPWQPLSVVVQKFIDAIGDPEALKTFLNTQLAETFEEEGEKPDFQRLYERRELYSPNTLPEGVVFLTGFADVQGDRFEVEIVGWGRDKQSWSIDYRVIMANTALESEYAKLDPLLNEVWKDVNGRELSLKMFGIDSGHATQMVYNWVRKHSPDRVRATDGRDGMQTVFGTPSDVDVSSTGKKLKRALKLWPIGVSTIKSQIYGWLQLDMPEDGNPFPPGYSHFPQYDLEHFKRLTSEQLVKRVVNGKTVYRWVKIHERNEQLDCRVGNRAVASMFGLDRFTDTDWDVLEGKFDLPEAPAANAEAESKPVTRSESSQNDFWARHRGKKLF